MTRNTFLEIVRIVQPVMEKRDAQLRRPIPKEKHRAIALWRLSLEIHSIQQQRHLLLENQQQYKLIVILALKFRD